MTKYEFIERLEKSLAEVSPEERVAAIQYYTEYLDDAGPQRENEVLAELGEPEKLAAEIRSSGDEGESWTPPPKLEPVQQPAEPENSEGPQLTLEPDNVIPSDDYSETPAEPVFPPGPGEPGWTGATPPFYEPSTPAEQNQEPPYYEAGPPSQQPSGTQEDSGWDLGKIILAVILAILLIPVLSGVLGTVFGLLAAALVVLAVPLIIGVAFTAAGIGVSIGGIVLTVGAAIPGITLLGVGLLLLGLGLLSFYFGIWVLRKLVPPLFRGVVGLCKKFIGLFRRKQPA